jgi:hypothetical protein
MSQNPERLKRDNNIETQPFSVVSNKVMTTAHIKLQKAVPLFIPNVNTSKQNKYKRGGVPKAEGYQFNYLVKPPRY